MTPPVFQIIWAAGFFDGEGTAFAKRHNGTSRTPNGYCTLGTPNGYCTLGIAVKQVEREPLDRFAAAVGVGRVRGPYQTKNPNGQPIHEWSVSGTFAEVAIAALWPHLTEPKREQIRRARRDVRAWHSAREKV